MSPFRARFVPADPSPEPSEASSPAMSRRARREAEAASRGRRKSRSAGDLRPLVARGAVLGALVAVTIVAPSTGLVLPGNGTIVAGGTQATYAPGELPTVIDALAAVPASDRVPDLLAFTETFDERILVAASRSSEREGIPGCDSDARPVGGNGQLSADGLCTIPWAERYKLRADAATSLAAMNTAYRARFDRDLCLASAYRTYSEQVRLKAIKGGLAAPAGKSNHGWGLAVDFCRTTVSGESWNWLEANGPTFGWVNPNWARRGGTGPYEPWHWEFEDAVKADGEYYG